jgi:hypothetical protein
MDELGMSMEDVCALPWVKAGVAKIIPNRFGIEIRIGAYVGRLGLGQGQHIDVEEMVPGTVSACIALSTSGRRRGGQAVVGRNKLSAHEEVAVRFSTLCAEVLSRGPVMAYVQSTFATGRPRGKIDVPTTLLKLRARGRFDLIQCKVRELSDDTPVNRILLAAAFAAERILVDQPLHRLAIRRCVAALSGARLLSHPAVPEAKELKDDAVADAVLLAETLLAGVPISPDQEGSGSAFSAWVNVDRIFEEAVRTTFTRIQHETRVVKGSECGIHLFHAAAGEQPAFSKRLDPDIVVYRDHGQTLVVDVKYRRSGEHPTEEQIYQLAAHASAFRADAAALFVPVLGKGPAQRQRYGRLTDGCSVDVVSVKANDLKQIEDAVTSWLDSIPSGAHPSLRRGADHITAPETWIVGATT